MLKRIVVVLMAALLAISMSPLAYAGEYMLTVEDAEAGVDEGTGQGGSGEGASDPTNPGQEDPTDPTDPTDPVDPEPEPISISGAAVKISKKTYVYTGSPIKPKAKVTLDGKTLKSTSYTVTYKKNTKVGTATVRVTGVKEAGYTGSTSTTFTIIPKQANLSSVKSPSGAKLTATVAKVPGAKGYQFRIGTNKSITKGVKKIKTTKRTASFAKLKQGKRYYVQVRAYAVIGGKTKWGAWSKAKSVTVKWNPVWVQSGGYYKYRDTSGKYVTGATMIGNRAYLFDSQGRQKTGWQYCLGAYRYFYPNNQAGGYMATGCVINGISIDSGGIAWPTSAGWEELSIMCKAQALVEQLTVPSQSRYEKLVRGFYYIKNDCVERSTRGFSNYNGWHRAMALDVFDGHTGSCFSYGAALAYYANAIGYGNCAAVSSGGHGWAEIDGLVYDPEWSKNCGRDLFAISYDESGYGVVPNYRPNRSYVVWISPRNYVW